jgi:hypothetical protein
VLWSGSESVSVTTSSRAGSDSINILPFTGFLAGMFRRYKLVCSGFSITASAKTLYTLLEGSPQDYIEVDSSAKVLNVRQTIKYDSADETSQVGVTLFIYSITGLGFNVRISIDGSTGTLASNSKTASCLITQIIGIN